VVPVEERRGMSSPDSNPYLPPKAPVADVEPVEPAAPMPTGVLLGVSCLYISLAIGVLRAMPLLFSLKAETIPVWIMVLGLAGGAGIIAVYSWLIFKIGRGRRWARITYLTLYLVALLGVVAQFSGVVESSGQYTVGTLVRNLLPAVGLAILFTPRSNAWFRQN
jgi:hypothetical protein